MTSTTRLLHVTEDHSTQNTGITSALDTLLRQLARKQDTIQLSLISTGGESIPVPVGVSATTLNPSGLGRSWRHAPGSQGGLLQAVKQADVIHLHGIWMWIQWAAARSACEHGKPFVLSVHGMLEPWIWRRQKWPHQLKKYIYWHLIAYPVFRHASWIHAINSSEAETLTKYFKNMDRNGNDIKIGVIPHSLDLETIDLILQRINSHFSRSPNGIQPEPFLQQNDPYILFLGRLHPVKGIDQLIQAFAQLDAPRVKLKIAGFSEPREAAYGAYLHKLVTDAGLKERVQFLGPVQDDQKWELLQNAWVFCLPSHSEVIGMVNLEAAACRTPVITTHATGLGTDWAKNGGVLVESESAAIARALTQALHWSTHERMERGAALRNLIENTYSWNATSKSWVSLYERLGATL